MQQQKLAVMAQQMAQQMVQEMAAQQQPPMPAQQPPGAVMQPMAMADGGEVQAPKAEQVLRNLERYGV
jgi:hypothetical protein